MGILNITLDSFSNAGEHYDHEIAVQYARDMVHYGADIIDEAMPLQYKEKIS